MPEYKVYCLDARGRIARRHDLFAADDRAAAHDAREMAPNVDCELWCGTRKVANLPAGGVPVWTNDPA